jgi:CHASE2 domain-containing sensor protein
MSVGGNSGSSVGGITLNKSVVLKVNWTPSATYRGFNIIEVNANNCSMSNYRQFDTHGYVDASNSLITYINGLPNSTVLVGVTADDPQQSLTTAATNALLAIGVNVTGLQFRGKVSFIAHVGRPSVALMKMKTTPPNDVLVLTADVRCKYAT